MQRSHWLTLAALAAICGILLYAYIAREPHAEPKSAPPLAHESVVPATPAPPAIPAPVPMSERPAGSVSTADRPTAPAASAVKPPPDGAPAATQQAGVAAGPRVNTPPPGPVPDGSMLSSTKLPGGSGFTPELEHVRTMLRDYRTIEGENPVGTNAEITKALMGGNKKGAQLVGSDAKVNGNGELVDQWGTPLFFHQLSKVEMEIRSAGPDGLMWTPDDLVTK